MQNAECKMMVSAPPMIFNNAEGIPTFCILHFEFCIIILIRSIKCLNC